MMLNQHHERPHSIRPFFCRLSPHPGRILSLIWPVLAAWGVPGMQRILIYWFRTNACNESGRKERDLLAKGKFLF